MSNVITEDSISGHSLIVNTISYPSYKSVSNSTPSHRELKSRNFQKKL